MIHEIIFGFGMFACGVTVGINLVIMRNNRSPTNRIYGPGPTDYGRKKDKQKFVK